MVVDDVRQGECLQVLVPHCLQKQILCVLLYGTSRHREDPTLAKTESILGRHAQ